MVFLIFEFKKKPKIKKKFIVFSDFLIFEKNLLFFLIFIFLGKESEYFLDFFYF